MARRRIFLSHSSPADPSDPSRLRAIATALQADGEGYEVFYDRRDLAVGDAWYATIATAMDRCNGAVLLMDRKALGSDYVRHEASVLGHRKAIEGDAFGVLVVRHAEVRHDDLDASPLRTAQFSRFQMASLPADTDDAALAQLVAQAAPGLWGPPGRGETPRERLIGKVGGLLRRIDGDLLEQAAEVPGVDPGYVDLVQRVRGEQRHLALARWLVGTSAEQPEACIALIGFFWSVLPDDVRSALQKLLWRAHGHWVGHRPDCPVAQMLSVTARGGAAAINGGRVRDYTAACFANNALADDVPLREIRCDPGARSVDAVAEQIRGALKSALPDSAAGGAVPVLCILPEGAGVDPADDFVPRLRQRFPKVAFVVWPGPDLDPAAFAGPVPAISPKICGDIETQKFLAWTNVQQLFETS